MGIKYVYSQRTRIMLSPFLRTHWINLSPNNELIAEVAPKGYEVIHYSYFRSYTLLTWRINQSPEKIYGESLWFNQTPLASSGGALDLYDEDFAFQDNPVYETPILAKDQLSVFKLINPRLGNYQVPKPVALYLRNPVNQVYLVLE